MTERPSASSSQHLCFSWVAWVTWLLVKLRVLIRVQLLLLKGHVSQGLRKGLGSG
jgi:hypothetical protein